MAHDPNTRTALETVRRKAMAVLDAAPSTDNREWIAAVHAMNEQVANLGGLANALVFLTNAALAEDPHVG